MHIACNLKHVDTRAVLLSAHIRIERDISMCWHRRSDDKNCDNDTMHTVLGYNLIRCTYIIWLVLLCLFARCLCAAAVQKLFYAIFIIKYPELCLKLLWHNFSFFLDFLFLYALRSLLHVYDLLGL